jgi:riboflavin synthase
MFTGIIEATGVVREIRQEGTNRHLLIESAISSQLKIDQSVSHNGVCLTVTGVDGGAHWVTAVRETLERSTFGSLRTGDIVNLERSMPANGRFDGHIVQGHVDQTARIVRKRDESGSWLFQFDFDAAGHLVVEKGSICVDGVSLTCFDTDAGKFSVAIIPYTFDHTNFSRLQEGNEVNLEFDIVGKYIQRMLAATSAATGVGLSPGK